MKFTKIKKEIYTISPEIEAHVLRQLEQASPFLRSFALKLSEDQTNAKDLFQDTALRIIFNAEKYIPGTNFKAWAFTIMRNTFINNYRKKVRQGIYLDATPNNYLLNLGGPSIENNGNSNMAYKELLHMVSALPENHKRPFWMAYTYYKYNEISEELKTPIGTIKSRIHVARQKLIKIYEQKQGNKGLIGC